MMVVMSDGELTAIRQSKLRELKKRLAAKQKETEQVDADTILNRIFRGRAWEVFNAASYQYPDVARRLKDTLVDLVLSGKLREVTGEQLYTFLKYLGLRVKLDTRIRFTEHGKLKLLSEKIKEDFRRS